MEAPRIPIRNLFYLLCYAWNHLKQGELVDVSKVPTTELVDLFALVLCDGIQHLSRRGLEQGYETREEEIVGIRGRMDVLRSARRFLPLHGRAACSFDELSANTQANQILKSTLRRLEHARGISTVLRFLLNVCELIHDSWLVDRDAGGHRFRNFTRDENLMARVFQDFLFHFIRLEVPSWRATREYIQWRAESTSDPALTLLPRMETDISLRRGTKKLIVEAKYYQNTLAQRFDTAKFHSANLYQLMTYLNQARCAAGETLEGMLIYPRVDRGLRERYTIQGYAVGVVTVDLSQEWGEVKNELLSLFV
jgi:5-methylcytosine-specific restriction enzyme subunit McrC